jgi:Mg2+-importing ATPase
MVSMALATPLLPFLPLVAKQILLNNFLSDIPSLAIASDSVDAERLLHPQRWSVREISRFMIAFGLTSSVFDMITFAVLLRLFHAREAAFQTSWFVISVLTELAALMVLRTRRFFICSRPSGLLAAIAAAVALVTVAAPYLDGISHAFGFVPLSIAELGAAAAITVGYVAATEIAKLWFYRRNGNGSMSPKV